MDIQLKPKPWYIKYRYYIMAGVAFLAFVVYVITLIVGPRQLSIDAEEYKIVEVENGHFMEYVDVEGVTQPILTLQINAMESGFVSRIVAEEGAILNEGDTILVLTNPELLRSIEDERDSWQNSQRNYREQEIEMEQKSITLRQQALDASHQMASLDKSLKQSREEYRMGIKSKAELEVAEEDYEYQKQKTQLQMQSLRHDSIATRLRREMVVANREAENKKLSRANNRTNGLVVRAPISGQLSYLAVTPGQQVSMGMSIGQIKDLSQYKVHTSLNEYYIDRITAGLPAKISYQDKTFPLSISRVVPEVKERSFDVDLVFSGQNPSNIRLGKSYRVQIELGKPERAIIIPRGDFYQHTGGKWIYRLSSDGKKATKVEIEIGRQNPQHYEIVSGLNEGDRVIVSGYDKFGDVEELVIE
ncbi:MAG: efflux RND transporter periplasmic adaptor subunit [Prevotella sp.]|nr:efflux RND transporter periplasmic adaptor subunit [Prevotella sp.]